MNDGRFLAQNPRLAGQGQRAHHASGPRSPADPKHFAQAEDQNECQRHQSPAACPAGPDGAKTPRHAVACPSHTESDRVSELGTRADPSVSIKLDKGAQATQRQQITILLHKPVGYVSGQPEPGFTPAVTLVLPENQQRLPDTPRFHASHLKGLAPAGRLDIDSTGLLVLTQDGRVARQLVGESSTVEKEYLVRVEGRLDATEPPPLLEPLTPLH